MIAGIVGGEVELSVLTQNVCGLAPVWPLRRRLLARRLREHRPLIIGLQEVLSRSGEEPLDQAEEIARAAGEYRVFFAPGRVFSSGLTEGVALLVHRDIEVLERSVEALTLDIADRKDRHSQRIVLRTAVHVAGWVIDVLVTHLSLSRRARVRTAAELLAFAERERRKSGSAGAILMGDFNEVPDKEAIRLLERGLAAMGDSCTQGGSAWIDAWKVLHGGAKGGTWPSFQPSFRIDYVFLQPAPRWRLTACVRLPFAGSDHLGLSARIDLG